jgi:hypothetical protein
VRPRTSLRCSRNFDNACEVRRLQARSPSHREDPSVVVENRPAAPALFLDELAEAERRLRTKPALGLVYTAHKSGVVRRVLLTRTSHRVYYRYLPERDELTVGRVGRSPRTRAEAVGKPAATSGHTTGVQAWSNDELGGSGTHCRHAECFVVRHGARIMIRKLPSGEYRLYSRKKDPKTGHRRNLGTFPTREAAKKHERAVQLFKRR